MGRRKAKKKNIILMIILIILIFLLHEQESLIGLIAQDTATETNRPPELYFCPHDSCEMRLATVLENANVSIHCAIYDVELPEIIDILKDKKNEIDVKLVTDKDNTKHLEGIEYVTNAGTHQLMHNKFCVIDDEIVFTGSYNPTITGKINDNNMLIIYSRYIALNYEREFSELSGKVFGKGDQTPYPVITLNGMRIENYFCPEDECAEHVMEILGGASESIDFMTFSFTHDGIGNQIIAKHIAGVKVRGVFEKFQNSQWNEYSKMNDSGIEARWDANPKNMHHKVFIVDGKIVVTGSFNPTKAGDTKNDENVLIIHDKEIADKYLMEFLRVYDE